MTLLARAALAVALMSAVLVGLPQPASATVVFAPGEGTSVVDGRVICNVGTGRAGAGHILCAGRAVYDALWAGAPCDEMGQFGCVFEDRIRAVQLGDDGRPKRAWFAGAGGSLDVRRGEAFRAGDLAGRRLSSGGFRVTNARGHGFTLTNQSYTAR